MRARGPRNAAPLASLATFQVQGVEIPWCATPSWGSDVPVVLLPGLGWRATGCVLSGYAPPGLPLLAFDYPRRWPRTALDSMAGLARLYAGLIEALGCSRVRLAGISTGGMVALELALAQPLLVESLTLVSTASAGAWVAGRWRMVASLATAGLLPAGPFYHFYRRWGPQLVGASLLSTPSECARLWGDPMSRRKMFDLLRAIARFDARDRLGLVETPTLVVHGERDALFPRAAATQLAAQIPAARLVLVERAGHFAFLTHRERVLAELYRFWSAGGGS